MRRATRHNIRDTLSEGEEEVKIEGQAERRPVLGGEKIRHVLPFTEEVLSGWRSPPRPQLSEQTQTAPEEEEMGKEKKKKKDKVLVWVQLCRMSWMPFENDWRLPPPPLPPYLLTLPALGHGLQLNRFLSTWSTAGIDPTRCALKWSFWVETVSRLFFFSEYVRAFDCETSSQFSQRNWLMFAPWTRRFYIPLLSPGCGPQGPLIEKEYVGVWREQPSDVSTHSLPWSGLRTD